MAESPCLCGLTTVRKGSRFIGRLQFWCAAISAVFLIVLLLLLIFYVASGGNLGDLMEKMRQQNPNYMMYYKGVPGLLYCVYSLVSIVATTYSGHILINATFNHNLQNIKTWLKINGILIIIGTVFNVVFIIITPSIDLTIQSLLGFCISAYFWTTVHQFCKDEKPSAFQAM